MSPRSAMLGSKLIKTSQQILNRSAPNFQNGAHFSEMVKISLRSALLGSKLNKKLIFPVGSQWSFEISLHVGHSVLTQKLKWI